MRLLSTITQIKNINFSAANIMHNIFKTENDMYYKNKVNKTLYKKEILDSSNLKQNQEIILKQDSEINLNQKNLKKKSFFSVFKFNVAKDIAIDLGTANTLIYLKDNGIILNEPSVIAIKKEKLGPHAVGQEARKMIGKAPSNIDVIRPLRDGVIADFKAAELMLHHFIRSSSNMFVNILFKRKIIICVPSGSTPVERRAIQDAALNSCNSEVFLIEEPMAAAIGANINVMQAKGSMIVDIGGGTTEIGITSLGGLVVSKSIRSGGDKFDEAIVSYIRKKYNLLIGEPTAERIKREIGTAILLDDEAPKTMIVPGRDLATGTPSRIEINSLDIIKSITETLMRIVEAIKSILEITMPEIASDIVNDGIVLAGGGALLHNIAPFISKQTSLPVYIGENPLFSVVNGIGKVLDDFSTYKYVLFKQD